MMMTTTTWTTELMYLGRSSTRVSNSQGRNRKAAKPISL